MKIQPKIVPQAKRCQPVQLSANFRILSKTRSTISLPMVLMPPGKIVGGVFLAANQLLRMEQLAVRTSANFINHLVSRTHRVEKSVVENMDTQCALSQKPTTPDPKEHRNKQKKHTLLKRIW